MADKTQDHKYPLNQIYFYLTEGCNLRCRHCWIAPKYQTEDHAYPSLELDLLRWVVEQAKPLGLTGVKLTGGEPLLHPRIRDILEIIRCEDLSLNVETNGLLCTPEIAAEIAKSSNRFVSVSIDGADSATHDWVRGVPGSFERAQQAVRNLVAFNTPPQIIMSVMCCNAHQVDALVRLAEGLGASSVKFNIVQPIVRGEMLQGRARTLDIAELIRLGRYVDMELAPTTKLRLVFDYPLVFRPLSRIFSGDGCNTCGILGILGVIASGHYALCGIGNHVPELVFGTVEKDRLEEVWQESSILNALRVGLPDKLMGICARCLMKHRCLASCIAQNYYHTGSLWAPFWFCEQAEEAGLFPDTRLGIASA